MPVSGDVATVTCRFRNVQRGTYYLTEKALTGYYLKNVDTVSANTSSRSMGTPALVYGKRNTEIKIHNVEKGGLDGEDEYAARVAVTYYKETFDDFRHSDSVTNTILIQ